MSTNGIQNTRQIGDRVRFKTGNGAVGEVTAINVGSMMATVDWGIVDPKVGRIIGDHPWEDLAFIERADAAEKRQAEIVERLKAQGKAGQG